LHPLEGVSQIIKVGDAIVTGDAAMSLMARFFEAQSSLDGPQSAEQLIQPSTRTDSGSPPPPFREDEQEEEADADWQPSSGGSSWSGGSNYGEEDSDSHMSDDVDNAAAAEDDPPLTRASRRQPRNQSSEFDQKELRQAEDEVRSIHAGMLPQCGADRAKLFSFSELCSAQQSLNKEASVSPINPIPVPLLQFQGSVWRCCLLGLMNLMPVCAWLPISWSLAPVAPIPKPGKDQSNLEGYRQFSLFSPFLKLLDKMLHSRVSSIIRKVTSPWQFGGNRGADEAAWLLLQLLFIYTSAGARRVWLAFIDVQRAFTRPAPAFILRAMHHAGIKCTEWMAIHAILGNLRGCLKIGSKLHGAWRVACGVPQGGALSMSLFAVVLVQLYNELQAAGCGINIIDKFGNVVLISLIAFVDDIVLIAQSPQQLQVALDIVAAWARRLRMRLNMGKEKSAIMIWGKDLCLSMIEAIRFSWACTRCKSF
jgi:hypothetical protein